MHHFYYSSFHSFSFSYCQSYLQKALAADCRSEGWILSCFQPKMMEILREWAGHWITTLDSTNLSLHSQFLLNQPVNDVVVEVRRHAVISLALQGVGRAVVVVQGVVARQVGHTGARVAQAGQGLMGGYQLCGTQILGKITKDFHHCYQEYLQLSYLCILMSIVMFVVTQVQFVSFICVSVLIKILLYLLRCTLNRKYIDLWLES